MIIPCKREQIPWWSVSVEIRERCLSFWKTSWGSNGSVVAHYLMLVWLAITFKLKICYETPWEPSLNLCPKSHRHWISSEIAVGRWIYKYKKTETENSSMFIYVFILCSFFQLCLIIIYHFYVDMIPHIIQRC